MIEIIKSPEPVIFSANLTGVRFSCSGPFSQVGVKSVNVLSFPGNIMPGLNVIIKFGNTTVIMTASLNPDDSGNQFLADGGPLDVEGFMIRSYFASNPQLAMAFDITNIGKSLYFKAKSASLGFDFLPDSHGLNTTAGLPPVKLKNYTILFKLWLENEDNTVFEQIYTTNLPIIPRTEFEAEAMIGDKLHVAISKSLRERLPEQPSTSVIQCKNSCRRYYFEFAESFGEPITVNVLNTSPMFTVLHGGLSSLGQFNKTVLGLISPDTPDNDKFLRQDGDEVLTRVDQPQYLYFYNSREARTLAIRIDFTLSDGTTTTETIPDVIMESNRKYAFNANLSALYQNPIVGKLVRSYQVYLVDGSSQASEPKTFLLDYSNRKYIRYFLNWSSFGAFDSRACYGIGESQIELSNKSAERIPVASENIQKGRSIVFDSRLVRSFKVATGWITKRQLLANADFYLSNLKYRYLKGLMMPIAISSGKIEELTDGNNMFSQSFEYSYLVTDHSYTEGDGEDVDSSIGGLNDHHSINDGVTFATKTFNTYQDMINHQVGVPTLALVLNDEKRGRENSQYTLWSNTSRRWLATVQDDDTIDI